MSVSPIPSIQMLDQIILMFTSSSRYRALENDVLCNNRRTMCRKTSKIAEYLKETFMTKKTAKNNLNIEG